jgi:hypothetical protein
MNIFKRIYYKHLIEKMFKTEYEGMVENVCVKWDKNKNEFRIEFTQVSTTDFEEDDKEIIEDV